MSRINRIINKKTKTKGQESGKHLIPNRIDTDYRPIEVDFRLEFGHFEADTTVSCKGSKSALLVAVDRKTRGTKIRKLTKKQVFKPTCIWYPH